jgi:hypothetical protein
MICLGVLALSVAPAVDAGGFGEQRLIQWGRQMVRLLASEPAHLFT